MTLLALLIGLVVMLIVSAFTQISDPPEPFRNSDGEVVEMKDRLGTLPVFRRLPGM